MSLKDILNGIQEENEKAYADAAKSIEQTKDYVRQGTAYQDETAKTLRSGYSAAAQKANDSAIARSASTNYGNIDSNAMAMGDASRLAKIGEGEQAVRDRANIVENALLSADKAKTQAVAEQTKVNPVSADGQAVDNDSALVDAVKKNAAWNAAEAGKLGKGIQETKDLISGDGMYTSQAANSVRDAYRQPIKSAGDGYSNYQLDRRGKSFEGAAEADIVTQAAQTSKNLLAADEDLIEAFSTIAQKNAAEMSSVGGGDVTVYDDETGNKKTLADILKDNSDILNKRMKEVSSAADATKSILTRGTDAEDRRIIDSYGGNKEGAMQTIAARRSAVSQYLTQADEDLLKGYVSGSNATQTAVSNAAKQIEATETARDNLIKEQEAAAKAARSAAAKEAKAKQESDIKDWESAQSAAETNFANLQSEADNLYDQASAAKQKLDEYVAKAKSASPNRGGIKNFGDNETVKRLQKDYYDKLAKAEAAQQKADAARRESDRMSYVPTQTVDGVSIGGTSSKKADADGYIIPDEFDGTLQEIYYLKYADIGGKYGGKGAEATTSETNKWMKKETGYDVTRAVEYLDNRYESLHDKGLKPITPLVFYTNLAEGDYTYGYDYETYLAAFDYIADNFTKSQISGMDYQDQKDLVISILKGDK